MESNLELKVEYKTFSHHQFGDAFIVSFTGANWKRGLDAIRALPIKSRDFRLNFEGMKNCWIIYQQFLDEKSKPIVDKLLHGEGHQVPSNKKPLPFNSDGLFDYQKKIVERMLVTKRNWLVAGMGSGKTIMSLRTAESFMHYGDAEFTLILTNRTLIGDVSTQTGWKWEVKKWNVEGNFLIKNWEWITAQYKKHGCKRHWIDELFNGIKFNLIIDEAQKNKYLSTQITRLVVQLAEKAERVITATGTALTNKTDSLMGQLKIIQHPVIKDVEYFKKKFCNRSLPYREFIVSQLELHEHIKDDIIRIKTKDVVKELPKATRHRVSVKLPSETTSFLNSTLQEYVKRAKESGSDLRKAYRYIPLINRSAALTAIAYTKMRFVTQLAHKLLPNGKVIIFSKYNGVIENLANSLKDYKPLILTGQTRRRDRLIQEFIQGDAQVLIANIKVANAGLNLVNCSQVIFADISYDPWELFQCEARIWRIGQKKEVHWYYPIMEDTVEVDMYENILSGKVELGNLVIDGHGNIDKDYLEKVELVEEIFA